MSIQSEIERIKFNVSSAYDAVAEKGGELPQKMNSDNLAESIHSIVTCECKEYTAGDGISISDDAINVINPNRGILTKEEFDLLPPEKKKSGTYIVDDGGEEVMVGANIYSTEEHIIGRWVDGNPLYRIAKEVYNISVTANVWKVIYPPIEDANVKYLFVAEIKDNSCAPICYSATSGTARVIALYKPELGIQVGYPSSVTTSFLFIIEYTKNTDNIPINTLLPDKDEVKAISPKIFVEKNGSINIEGEQYEYEFPDDVFAQGSFAGAIGSSIASIPGSGVNFEFTSVGSDTEEL